MNDLDLIARLQSITDAEATRLASPGARADLSRQITGEPAADRWFARARRSRRWLVAVPVAVGLASALAVTTFTSPARTKPAPPARGSSAAPVQAQALSFTRHDGHIDVTVRDPLADPARYRAEFRAHGLDISIKLVPASPSIVGTLVYYDSPPNSGLQPITAKGKCVTGGGGACPVGVQVPLDFKGTAHLVFGRAARPGEQYESSARSATVPGEALAGLSVIGKRVADVSAMMKQRHVTAVWVSTVVGGKSERLPLSKVPGTWYVYEVDPWAPGQVAIWAGATVTRPRQSPDNQPPQAGPGVTPTASPYKAG